MIKERLCHDFSDTQRSVMFIMGHLIRAGSSQRVIIIHSTNETVIAVIRMSEQSKMDFS